MVFFINTLQFGCTNSIGSSSARFPVLAKLLPKLLLNSLEILWTFHGFAQSTVGSRLFSYLHSSSITSFSVCRVKLLRNMSQSEDNIILFRWSSTYFERKTIQISCRVINWRYAVRLLSNMHCMSPKRVGSSDKLDFCFPLAFRYKHIRF